MASGGAIFPIATAAEMVGSSVYRAYASRKSVGAVSAGPFRPPQWAQPALTTITVPPNYNVKTPSDGVNAITSHAPSAAGSANASADGTFTMKGAGTVAQTALPVVLVFDGVIRLAHSQRAVPTRLPIQDGASLTDHIRLEPATLTLGVIMTDVYAAFSDGMWTGAASKSVACFQYLDGLRAQRVPLTVKTRLKTYSNMIIADIPAEDTVETRWGLRTPVQFEQIFVGSVAVQGVGARTQSTDTTSLGQTAPVTPSAGVTAQNGVPDAAALESSLGKVIGAGLWSSNSNAGLGV